MISPFTELTIGQMYNNTPGVITELSYTIMDEGTWETTFAKLPKYIQVTCGFKYIGKRLPAAEQKHFELPWVASQEYVPGMLKNMQAILEGGVNAMLAAPGLNEIDLGRNSAKIAEQAHKDNPWLATESEDDDAWAAGEG